MTTTTDFVLTADELAIVRMALRRCDTELEAQMNGAGTTGAYTATASAWFACDVVRSKIAPLLERVEKKLKESES
jgi:hypothetical protein